MPAVVYPFFLVPVLLAISISTGAAEEKPASPAYKNRLIGVGEPTIPQPFTREQRMLQAARDGKLKVIMRALELGVDVNTKDELGRSSLLLATHHTDSLELIRGIHEQGGEIDGADSSGRTPLSYAAAKGKLAMMKYLAAKGADADRGDKRGRTPLYYAASEGQVDAAAFLIAQGVNINSRDKFGDTPLMLPCAKGHKEMVTLLLEGGADPTLADQEGRTVYDRAVHAPGCRERLPARDAGT